MGDNQQIWANWARTLHRWGVDGISIFLLETAGGLSELMAQAIYLSQPLLAGAVEPTTLQKVALMLENPSERKEFVSCLREAPTRGTAA